MNDLVSVVIPTFNRSKSLERAIDSIFSQTYKDWELIVIDNSSTDDTYTMLKKYDSKRVKVLTVKNHGVIGYSRNIGVKKAKGKFIAFLDSDDWWEKTKLSRAIKALNKNKSDIVYHDCTIISRNSSSISKCRHLNSNTLKDLVVNGNTLITSSVVVSRDSLLGVGCFSERSEVVGWEDYHLWLKLAKKSCKFYKVSGNCGYYWQGIDNFDSPKRVLKNLTKIEEHLKDEYASIADSYNIWWINYTRGRSNLKSNNIKNAKEAFACVLHNKAPIQFKLKSLFWRLYIIFHN